MAVMIKQRLGKGSLQDKGGESCGGGNGCLI